MARKPPQPLTLTSDSIKTNANDQNFLETPTPLSPKSPKSPKSPFRFTTKKTQLQAENTPSMHIADLQTRSTLPPSQTTPSLSSLQYPAAAGGEEGRERERERPTRSGFFSNYKASKSSSRLQSENARLVNEEMSRDSDRPAMTGKGSSNESARNDSGVDRSLARRPVGAESQPPSTSSPRESSTTVNTIKKNKPKPFSLLGRTRSIRGDENSPRDSSPNSRYLEPEPTPSHNTIKTAPLRSDTDRSFREMMSSNVRQHSADRVPSVSREEPRGREHKESVRAQPSFSSSFREGGGHTFLTNLKNGASKGAGAISKGLFGKGGRSGSTTEREPVVDDEHYVIKVLNMPLVEQTRKTRISKRLEDSRDKTEFWMPAFPWRAIDYLNYKGSDVEGLYRVPGSGPQIKKWQRRFDEELDIDLFEQDDLYDINIIGSMLKAWLRELPDELFPKAAQDRIARECSGADTVPQLLIDELSNLSPFNYYLLFAITCHLSLLLAHSEKNKMDFRNLCICFQPCMKIDAFCFKFLVCDWRDCWKGCKTEPQYTEAEYQHFKMMEGPPNSAEGRSSTAVESHDERNVSSSDSSKPSSVSAEQRSWGQGKGGNWGGGGSGGGKKEMPKSQSDNSLSTTISSTTLTVGDVRTPPRKSSADMRPLSPIKPLSPIGL